MSISPIKQGSLKGLEIIVYIEALAKVFSCWVWMVNKLAAQARL